MFEVVFKYPHELYQRGELVFSPLPAGAETLVVMTAAMLLVGASLVLPERMRGLVWWRRLLLGLLQSAFVAGVLLLLSGPAMQVATLAPGANTVAVLLDTSTSMGFDAGAGPGSRLAAAVTMLNHTLLPSLERSSEVTTFVFGRGARKHDLVDLRASEPRTRLVGALEDVLAGFRGAPLAALVVVSDGADNVSDGDLSRLHEAGVPVHTIGVGPSVLPGEVSIAEVVVPGDAAPDSRVVAEVVIAHDSAGPAVVKVFDGARLVAAHRVVLAADSRTLRVPISFDSGPGGIRELAFAVEPPPGDGLAGNNRLARLLTVSSRHRRVLYLEGEPRWEYKFIRRAVGGDDVLELSSWLRTTHRKTYRQDVADPGELSAGFPESRDGLYRYDVIVLGSLGAAHLSDEQHQWLESFVAERGGSLLALAGREALADGGWDLKPLANALPVRLVRADGGTYGPLEGRVRPTALGLRSPVTQLVDAEGVDPWSTLPALADYQRLGSLKPAAAVLLEMVVDHEPHPLLVTQPYGLGTTAVLATATTWRWRMRTPADDQRHTLFWRQLLRQLGELARQPRDLQFDVLGDTVQVRLMDRDRSFRPRSDVTASVVVSGPGVDGDRLALAPAGAAGVVEGRYRPPGPGVYRMDVSVDGADGAITRFVRVGEQHPEQTRPARNETLLRRIAEVTGGRYWSLQEAGDVARSLRFASAGVRRNERFPLWDMPAALLVLLVLKGSEWLLRRRWGRL